MRVSPPADDDRNPDYQTDDENGCQNCSGPVRVIYLPEKRQRNELVFQFCNNNGNRIRQLKNKLSPHRADGIRDASDKCIGIDNKQYPLRQSNQGGSGSGP